MRDDVGDATTTTPSYPATLALGQSALLGAKLAQCWTMLVYTQATAFAAAQCPVAQVPYRGGSNAAQPL